MNKKTLNDILKENIEIYGEDSLFWEQKIGEAKKFVFVDRIKEEAIKWLFHEDDEGIKNFIETFFDITDEDIEEYENRIKNSE